MAITPPNPLPAAGPLNETHLKAIETMLAELTAGGDWHAIEKGHVAVLVAAQYAPILNGQQPSNSQGLKPDDVLRQEMTNNVVFAARAPGLVSRLLAEIRDLNKQIAQFKASGSNRPAQPGTTPPTTPTSPPTTKP